jgi:F-type H+-transporting ATPase subunit a
MQLLGLLTGIVQAYIFAILAGVYIAAGLKVHEDFTKETGQLQPEFSVKE